MAQTACWSPYHFSRTFQAITGRPPGEYVRLRKMDSAAYRLRFSKENILDVAIDLGYESQTAFTRAFKRIFGATPGMYRREGSYVMICEGEDFGVYEAARMVPGGGECDIYIPVKPKAGA